MDLALSKEQMAVAEVFDSFFEKSQSVQRTRTAGTSGFDRQLWQAMCEMGAAGIAISEQDGGAGAGLVDAALVCEEVSRHIAPVPYVETCVAARVLAAAGQSELLDDVLSGSAIATFSPRAAIHGTWHFVPNGAIAAVVIGMVDDQLVVSRPAQPQPVLPNLADLPIADCRIGDGPHTVIAAGEAAATVFACARDEWRVLSAAALVGMAAGALKTAVTYVKERTQFGVPLGSFQSIAHHLADCHAALDGARMLSQEAAWAFDQSTTDASTLAAMAFYFAAQTAEQVTGWSLHFHGGYGFMLEYDVQLFYRRAKAWSLLHGDREAILDEVAERVFTPAGAL
jgi:alkylation response protein AidB-like acyl-CoA dehydrogenase